MDRRYTMKNKQKVSTTPRKPSKPTSGLKIKTQVKAAGPFLQHNEKLVRR